MHLIYPGSALETSLKYITFHFNENFSQHFPYSYSNTHMKYFICHMHKKIWVRNYSNGKNRYT